MLDPDVVLRADPIAVEIAAARAGQGAPSLPPEAFGARAVAQGFGGRARTRGRRSSTACPGAAWAPGGVVRAAFAFAFVAGRIAGIDIVMDARAPARAGGVRCRRHERASDRSLRDLPG